MRQMREMFRESAINGPKLVGGVLVYSVRNVITKKVLYAITPVQAYQMATLLELDASVGAYFGRTVDIVWDMKEETDE